MSRKHETVLADMVKKAEDRIEELKKERDEYKRLFIGEQTKRIIAESDSRRAVWKIELYEKLLNKFMEGHPDKTDEFIMFEGKIYKLQSATLDMEPSERADILTLECVKVDFPK